MEIVQSGLDLFAVSPPSWIKKERLGLLLNQASINQSFVLARDVIHQTCPNQLKALFSPQHGYFGAKQDNMIESDDLIDPVLDIPVYSLYGKTRKPNTDMFNGIDTLIIDIQDVGTRVYTFIWTMSYCMEVAKECGIKVLVLDRPNPIGGYQIEGNCLDTSYASFVGRYPIPMRHGLTIGELACLFNEHFGIGCNLQVLKMAGWNRHMYFKDTGLPWVAPSPNMPTPNTAMVYPGQVIWEGTSISEGRGTSQPFEIFGAPFLSIDTINQLIGPISGCVLRPLCFEPTFHKWAKQLCDGFQIHVTYPNLFLPFQTSIKLLWSIWKIHKDRFEWKSPPYEYEYHRLPIDMIFGTSIIREMIEEETPVKDIFNWYNHDTHQFSNIASKFYLYH